MPKIIIPARCMECSNTTFSVCYSGANGTHGLYQEAGSILGLKYLEARSRIIYIVCKSCGLIAKQYAATTEHLN